MNRIIQIHTQLNPLSAYTKLEVEKLVSEQIGIIYLNSPKDLNALTLQMRNEIIGATTELDSDQNIKVIVLLSKVEKALCAGANIKEFESLTHESQILSDVFEHFHEGLAKIKKPIIVGVNGVALGGGLELVLFGDIVVAAEDARFGLPELKLGLFPGLSGTQRFAKIAGRTNAMRYILTTDFFNAKQGQEMGVVNQIVPKDQLKEECLKMARKVSEKSLYSLIIAKYAVRQAEEMPLRQGSMLERALFSSLFNTKAPKEGSRAFVEKRAPNFKDI